MSAEEIFFGLLAVLAAADDSFYFLILIYSLLLSWPYLRGGARGATALQILNAQCVSKNFQAGPKNFEEQRRWHVEF